MTITAVGERSEQRLMWARNALGDAAATLGTAMMDASARGYWRLSSAGATHILMAAPPPLKEFRAWLSIGERRHEAGLHVPTVLASDTALGLAGIEDLCDRHYLDALRTDDADALYAQAMDALLRMQAVPAHALPPYDHERLLREMALLREWFLARHLDATPSGAEQRVLDRAFAFIAGAVMEQPRCFVHRDYHSRNLLLASPNPGIIDFQGARYGPLTYDLASLLRDCYIRWDETCVSCWVEAYRQRLLAAGRLDPTIDAAQFMRWVDLTGMQRHLKVLGIFCRLHYRDGKNAYLNDLPRVWSYVNDIGARYPELHDLLTLLRRHVGDRELQKSNAA